MKNIFSSPIKLIVSDVDGTLLPKSRVITPATRDVLTELKQRGMTLVLASSRPPRGMVHILEDAGMMESSVPFISMNGAVIAKSDKTTLYSAQIDAPTVQRVYELVYDIGINFMLLDEKGWWSSANDELVRREAASLRFEPILDELNQRMQSPVNKITLLGKPEQSAEAKRRIDEYLGDAVSASSPANPKFIDITAANVHKGTAVLRLAEILGVKKEEICAIGDGENDIEMFRVAGMSIAMENAAENVRHAASHLTSSSEEDGWAKAIQSLILDRIPS